MSPFLLVGFALLILASARKKAPVLVHEDEYQETETMVNVSELRYAPGFYLRTDAAKAFDRACEKAGMTPKVNSATRTRSQQEALYRAYLAGTGNLAAKPGTSKHEFGLAVDARGSEVWEREMEAEGFRRTVASEPWHWEFSK